MPTNKYFALLHPEKGLVGEMESDNKTFPNEKNPEGIILDLIAIRHTEQQAENLRAQEYPECEVVYLLITTQKITKK